MSSATQSLPPTRFSAIRRGAAWLHLALALAVAFGAFLQVYLIGAYIFGTVQTALADAERWTGGLHPLGALLVLALATVIVVRDRRRRVTLASAPAEGRV